MIDQETMKCPKCNSEKIWDLDCETCQGTTEVEVGEDVWEGCPDCNGEGVIQNQFECGDCHHIWEEI